MTDDLEEQLAEALQRRGRVDAPALVTQPVPESEVDPEPEATPLDGAGQTTLDALDAALDSLGSAHHRPYSRA